MGFLQEKEARVFKRIDQIRVRGHIHVKAMQTARMGG
jgi:hypothetical protein